jgi:geranylgeranyl diphosphate synthase type II
MAFQLQDDLLDVFADAIKFGKNLGGDIVANKKTYLLIKALEQAEGKDKEELDYWLSQKEFDPKEKINAVTKIYKRLNIKQYSIDLMQYYFAEADRYLGFVNIPENKKKNLIEFTESLKTRDF